VTSTGLSFLTVRAAEPNPSRGEMARDRQERRNAAAFPTTERMIGEKSPHLAGRRWCTNCSRGPVRGYGEMRA